MAQKLGICWVVLFIFTNKKGDEKLPDGICVSCLLKMWNLSPSQASRALVEQKAREPSSHAGTPAETLGIRIICFSNCGP